MKKPTVKTLADELNLSRQTVSNVLNAPDRVKPETRERVEEAIRRSGYRPSVAARALRNQRSMSIALCVPPVGDGINGAVMDGFLHALVEGAARLGYRITLFTAHSTADELAQLTQLRESNAIDACVLSATYPGDPRPQELAQRGIPFAAFGRPWGGSSDHAWVDVDGKAGIEAAVRFLQAHGAKRIGFIGWPETSGVGADRRSGWVSAVGDTAAKAQLEIAIVDTVANGAAGARKLVEAKADGIVCASDSLALGALTEVRRLGLETGVVGNDDTPVARAIGLSSVRQPVEEAAQTALRQVLAQLAGSQEFERNVLLTPELVVRPIAGFLA